MIAQISLPPKTNDIQEKFTYNKFQRYPLQSIVNIQLKENSYLKYLHSYHLFIIKNLLPFQMSSLLKVFMTLLVISTIKCDKPTAGPVYSYYAPHPTAATVATTTTIPPPPPGELQCQTVQSNLPIILYKKDFQATKMI